MNPLRWKDVLVAQVLMLGLVSFLAAIPFMEHHDQFPPLWYGLTFMVFTSAGVAMVVDRWRGLVVFGLGLAAMATLMALGGPERPRAHIIPGFMFAVSAVVTSCLVAKAALSKQTHGDARMYHGVSSYILIGMAFATLHQRVDMLVPGAYHAVKGDGAPVGGWGNYVWLSFSILTTAGFNVEAEPANSMSRALCTLEAITGVMFPAIFLARIVSAASKEIQKENP